MTVAILISIIAIGPATLISHIVSNAGLLALGRSMVQYGLLNRTQRVDQGLIDAERWLTTAAERYNDSEPVNLGNAFEIGIPLKRIFRKDLVETITRHTGFTGKIVWDKSKSNGQPRRKLDISRAEQRFGFKSQTSFEEGLRRTVEAYDAACQPGAAVSEHA